MEHQQEPRENGESAPPPERAETFSLTSGRLVIIDQFMVANRQLLIKLISSCPTAEELTREGSELGQIIEMYGGCVISLNPGTYRVLRDAQQSRIVVCPSENFPEQGELSEEKSAELDSAINEKSNSVPAGKLMVDTRCMVMMDAALFADSALLDKYQRLRAQQRDKAARDLLREHGAAVRYGFRRHGDELGVFELDQNTIALWPDVVEA